MRPIVRSAAVLVSLVVASGPAWSQNRMVNGDLNDIDGVAGWSLVAGTSLSHDVNDLHECPSSGSALSEALLGLLTVVRSPCVPIVGGETLDVSVWVETAPLLVSLGLQPFSGPGCSAPQALPILPITSLDFSEPGWQELSATGITAPASAQSAQLEITGAIGLIASEIYIDRAFLGSPGHVFSDDFEGGSPCRWSASQT